MKLFFLLLIASVGLLGADARRKQRVIRGYETKPHEFPSIALMEYRRGTRGPWRSYCSGTLLNNRSLLTAAHCKLPRGLNLRIVAGAHQRSLIPQTPGVQIARVKQQIPHPKFSKSSMSHDIMILRLATSVKETKTVKYVRLPTNNRFPKAKTDCQLVGWGKTSVAAGPSDVLRRAPMTAEPQIVDKSGDRSKLFARPAGEQQSSGCKGDSGGPLYCPARDGSAPFQVGVVSGGDGICGSKRGLARFGNIAYALKWIRQNS